MTKKKQLTIDPIPIEEEKLHHVEWIHGHSGHVESSTAPNVEKRGSGLRVESDGNDIDPIFIWVHYAIPSISVFDERGLFLESVLLDFETGPSETSVDRVDVYDGGGHIRSLSTSFNGSHPFERLDVPGHPGFNRGLGFSLRLRYAGSRSTVVIRSVGAIFILKSGLIATIA